MKLPREPFAIVNPNRGWVAEELKRLQTEWDAWQIEADGFAQAPDSLDYNPQTCAEGLKDGWENRKKHSILREKTLVFIGNNFSGYSFLFEDWPSYPHEDNISRLHKVVPGWVHRLAVLSATIGYAHVPDGFWKARGKQLVETIAKNGPERAGEIAASWLKNPFGGE